MAMIIVMMLIMLITALPLIVFSEAIQQLPLARHEQDHESALHAAEAGVDDYVNHLNLNTLYWSTADPSNAAFGGWVPIPGPANSESFTYYADTSKTATQGIIFITSSGRSMPAAGGVPVIRTVRVGVRTAGFLDWSYFTNYELADPLVVGSPRAGGNTADCILHQWEYGSVNYGGYSYSGFGPDMRYCGNLISYFGVGSVMTGSVHSNDGLYICGVATFNGLLETEYNLPANGTGAGGGAPWTTTGKKYIGPGPTKFTDPAGCGGDRVVSTGPNAGISPIGGADAPFPSSDLQIKSYTQVIDIAGKSGCLYTGPTQISFHYVGATGYMDVKSPNTLSTHSWCKTTAGSLQSAGGAVNIPLNASQFNGTIYIQTTPTLAGDPNTPTPLCSTACSGAVTVSQPATGGGVFGGIEGQITVAADDLINVNTNLTYANGLTGSTATDVLGLIANNGMALNPNGTSGRTIDAAIITLNHSMYVPNVLSQPVLGTLTINGSITQNYDGFVGVTNGQGYVSAYAYDPRLQYLSPPYYLQSPGAPWQRDLYSELPPKDLPLP